MKEINQYYAKFFNEKYNFIGRLYQGRYKSELIENDAYNLQTSRYIHLNPVQASMVGLPVEYKWSSYPAFMGEVEDDILNEDAILSYFKGKSRNLYKNYVESKLINFKRDKKEKVAEGEI